MPALIYPNPLSPDHYVVINSGLTAAWADWAGDFPMPRYGDFAIFKVQQDSDDPEAKVSRRHARISIRDGNYLIEDLGSTNGTFVNRGRRLAPGDRCPLKDGDEIIVGKTFLRFRVAK